MDLWLVLWRAFSIDPECHGTGQHSVFQTEHWKWRYGSQFPHRNNLTTGLGSGKESTIWSRTLVIKVFYTKVGVSSYWFDFKSSILNGEDWHIKSTTSKVKKSTFFSIPTFLSKPWSSLNFYGFFVDFQLYLLILLVSPYLHIFPPLLQPQLQIKVKFEKTIMKQKKNLVMNAEVWPIESHSFLFSPFILFASVHWSGSRPPASAAPPITDSHWGSSWISCCCPVSWRSCSF